LSFSIFGFWFLSAMVGADATAIPTSAAIPRSCGLVREEIEIICHEESDHAVKIEMLASITRQACG
jgi:hypothetical protein